MIGIILIVLEFILLCTLLGLVLGYIREEDVDLSQLAVVVSVLYVIHRMRRDKKHERQRQFREFKNR